MFKIAIIKLFYKKNIFYNKKLINLFINNLYKLFL